MTTPLMTIHINNKIKMKMKTITKMNLPPKNLHFQHIIHNKHQHQYTLNPLEFPLEL